MYTLNCAGNILVAEKPLVMGILNYTSDSFYEGSRLANDKTVTDQAIKMAEEGADILDIGAQSTRPGSSRIPAREEIKKLIPLVSQLKKETGKFLSVDTYHADVARASVEAGADIINDISGGNMDEQMIATAGKLQVPYICMHTRGTPENMQQLTSYGDILKELLDYFIERIEKCRSAGIHDVIIDPGFGFAKTIEQNFFLLRHLRIFKIPGKPIIAGLSRKSTIYRSLKIQPGEALNGTTVLNTLALENGADILRVHDVKEAVETVKLWQLYQQSGKNLSVPKNS